MITPKMFQALQWFADNDGVSLFGRDDPSHALRERLLKAGYIERRSQGTMQFMTHHITPLGRATLIFGNTDKGHAYIKALELACAMLVRHEPGDSRAVSDEFVAIAAVAAGIVSDDVIKTLEDGLTRLDPPVTITVDTSRRARSRDVCGND